MKDKKTVHFIGLCGAGMSAVARLYQEMGWEISGSDQGVYDPVKSYLEKCGMTCKIPHQAANLPANPDLIVIGRHAKLTVENNEEVRAAYQKFPDRIISFPLAIEKLTRATTNYVVVGSYGKSTCTALMAWILMHLGHNPSYFIGAIPIGMEYTSRIGSSDVFVLEGDEYPSSNTDDTSKFIYYHASSLLLTSAEHDHVNVFPTIEDYLKPFFQLIRGMDKKSTIVAGIDHPNVKQLLAVADCRIVTYGWSDQADWQPRHIKYGPVTKFDLMKNKDKVVTLQTSLIGKHNIENITGVCVFLLEHGLVSPENILEPLRTFQGIVRRLDKKSDKSSLVIYEGFGSSYTKARTAIEAIRLHYPGKRLIIVFEPHTFSWRNKNTIDWYDSVFAGSAEVLIHEPPAHGKQQHEQLTLSEIVARTQKNHPSVYPTPDFGAITGTLQELLSGNEVVLLLTSGSFDGHLQDIVEWMEKVFPGN